MFANFVRRTQSASYSGRITHLVQGHKLCVDGDKCSRRRQLGWLQDSMSDHLWITMSAAEEGQASQQRAKWKLSSTQALGKIYGQSHTSTYFEIDKSSNKMLGSGTLFRLLKSYGASTLSNSSTAGTFHTCGNDSASTSLMFLTKKSLNRYQAPFLLC